MNALYRKPVSAFLMLAKCVDFLKFINYEKTDITYSLVNEALYDVLEKVYMSILESDNTVKKENTNFVFSDEEIENEPDQNEIFSSYKMTEAQQQVITNPHYLKADNANQLREQLLTETGLERRDLADALITLEFYYRHPIPRKVKPKSEPYGVGMEEIAPQVLSGRRDIRRINDR